MHRMTTAKMEPAEVLLTAKCRHGSSLKGHVGTDKLYELAVYDQPKSPGSSLISRS